MVLACLAFEFGQRRLFGFDTDRTAGIVEELQSGLNRFNLSRRTPFVAMAADCQQVQGWPAWSMSCVEADAVVTPTRILDLDSGKSLLDASEAGA